ncbi:pilin [Halobacterium sp. KA-6]|uniref:pilin n=1 Tax=Halobacterium sp. KA-6 TaxID=2896368 RepID=UPI001E444CA6|nr:pilin [Halobacterium sp. KA-6]MCD2205074.1 pilin [Halobacterium sp. KA-6]
MSKRSHSTTTESPSNNSPSNTNTHTTLLRRVATQGSTWSIQVAVGIAFLALAVGPAAAASNVGSVYCDTGVATGIDLIFGAVAGLGLPITGLYTGKAGLSYMTAGGNPEKKNKAKDQLVMSGIGFGIVVLALVSPELIDNVGSQMGFGFSECVKPF